MFEDCDGVIYLPILICKASSEFFQTAYENTTRE